MSSHMPERDPHSELEDEGIPDLEDSTPERELAADPQRPSVPGEQPVAVDDFGTTAAEQAAGEPLDQRADREVPEDQAMFGGAPEPVRQPAAAAEELPDRSDDLDSDDLDSDDLDSDDLDAVTEDSGLGVGADLDTDYEPSGPVADDPRHAGRLVAPDEGAHPAEEGDAVASEAGPDSGGYTAEESAMRVADEEPGAG